MRVQKILLDTLLLLSNKLASYPEGTEQLSYSFANARACMHASARRKLFFSYPPSLKTTIKRYQAIITQSAAHLGPLIY